MPWKGLNELLQCAGQIVRGIETKPFHLAREIQEESIGPIGGGIELTEFAKFE